MLAIFAQQPTALFGAKSITKPKSAAFSVTSLPGNFNALGGGEVVPGGVWDPVSQRLTGLSSPIACAAERASPAHCDPPVKLVVTARTSRTLAATAHHFAVHGSRRLVSPRASRSSRSTATVRPS